MAGARSLQHHEITRYGAPIAWAKALGRQDRARLLAETLDKEKNAERKPSSLAERNGGN